MHSTSRVTCSPRTAATVWDSVISDSGRRRPTATNRFERFNGEAYHLASAVRSTGVRAHGASPQPVPYHRRRERTANTASSGWGEAPLVLRPGTKGSLVGLLASALTGRRLACRAAFGRARASPTTT